MTNLAWGSKVSPEFRRRVIAMASRDGYDPSHAMAIMYFESKLKANAINVLSGASGLIQFMPSTAIDLNTTIEAIRGMSEIEQLDYVDRYFHRYAGRLHTLSDAYMAVLWPKAVGQPEDYVLFQQGSKAYEQNKALDINGDGKITKAEATSFVLKALNEGMAYATLEGETQTEEPQVGTSTAETTGSTINTIAGIAGLFNPLVGGLLAAFSPLLTGKLTKLLTKTADTPEQAAQIANSLSATLMGQARALTGQSDDFNAASKIASDPAQAENKAKLEAALNTEIEKTLDRLSQVADKSIPWDQAMWHAQIEGRNSASTVAIAERRAGIWDMTPFVVRSLLIMLWGIAWGLSGAIIAVCFQDDPDAMVLTALIGLAGPIWTGAIVASVAAIVSYRFDGSKNSSDQTKVLLAAASNRNPM